MNYHLKNLLILFKALIDEHGVTLGMPFWSTRRMVDLQIAGNSKIILIKYRNKIMTSMSQKKMMIPEHR